ncbi:DUF2993 domain-containing protein [Kribbella sp. NPDC056861]|uniref:LmeA family phospholipid-binding protein n=1 Tax=Kribbella sp. NPDC056861 TaxID=3154857 RepID=UPI00343A9350
MSSRKPRRALRALIVILLILVGLGIAADRVGESLAEDRLATSAAVEAAQYDVRAADTSVEIGGFGFLPQVARSEFEKVTLTMREPTIENIPAENLTVEMHNIHVPRQALTGDRSAVVTVEKADLNLRLAPAGLLKLTTNPRGIDALKFQIVDGKLIARVTVRGLDASAAIQPVPVNGKIGFVVDRSVLDNIPERLRSLVSSALARGIAVPELPFKAQLQRISVEGQTLVLTATAADLKL